MVDDGIDPAAEAESAVAEWLASRGWAIVERNLRLGPGEIDIIACRSGIMAFVEVKLASTGSATMAPEKIDRRKRSKIAGTAATYLSSKPFGGDCRFDVAVVRGLPGDFEIDYLENAFVSDTIFTV